MPATRDVIRPRPVRPTVVNIHLDAASARRPAARAPARDATASIVASLDKMKRHADAIDASMARTRDALTRLAPIVAARKAMKDADAAYAARAARSSPAAVQAANAARWPRPGR